MSHSRLITHAGSEIFKNIEERVAAELDAYGSPSPMPPISWTESQARVHARDEERKRQIARRERARQQRNHQAAYQDPATLPGASLTRLSDQSVFWMHMEVRNALSISLSVAHE